MMMHFMPCEICKENHWTVLAEKVFYANETESLDEYTRNIYTFLFEMWFPGKTEICVKNLCCNHCGFICFSPRPGESELQRMYTRRDPVLKIGYHPKTDIAISQRRSRLLFEYLRKRIDMCDVRKVLDFGGNDGSLLNSFLLNDKKCYLIDYSSYCVPTVTKLGNTINDLKQEDVFELIICSHVMEHVVSPIEVLGKLSHHLSERGILFVEVPMEIWKHPPLLEQKDPVTHVNFFSPNSLKNLFIVNGMKVDNCEFVEYLHASSSWNPGIRCIGRHKKDNIPALLLKKDAHRFLKPDVFSYFQFYSGNRYRFKKEILKRIGIRNKEVIEK